MISIAILDVSLSSFFSTIGFHLNWIKLKVQQNKLLITERHEAWESIARKLAHEIKNPLTPQGDLLLIVADLTIGKGPFKDTYKSDVKFDKENSTINVTNIGGPLNHLENNWKFNEMKGGTEISFDIDFEIENKFLNVLMSKSFEFGLNKIADAFQKRAEDLYRPIDN